MDTQLAELTELLQATDLVVAPEEAVKPLEVSSPRNAENDDVDLPNDLTCAICLNTIAPADIAIVKGCEHLYCAHCILQWAHCKESVWCPQCKTPFSYLFCYRLLDGTPTDYPVEESVCLLKRACWYTEHIKVQEKGPAISSSTIDDAAVAAALAAEWVEPYDDYEDEDEEIEDFYFSSAAGRARVVLGNRRWGENGSVKNGRMYARPVNNNTNGAGPSGSSSGSSPPTYSKGVGKVGQGRGNAGNPNHNKQPHVTANTSGSAAASGSGSAALSGSGSSFSGASGSAPPTTPVPASGSSRFGGGNSSTPISIRSGGRNPVVGEADVAGSGGIGGSPAGGSCVGKGRRAKRHERRAADGVEAVA